MTTAPLARVGSAAALTGAVVLLASTLLHPAGADPNDPAAAFAEYAADRGWVWSHLGQFLGLALLGAAVVALGSTLEDGWAGALGRLGSAGAVAGIAVAAALQAVDGIALKAAVDRWAESPGEAKALAFEAAFAVRQVEIGLAALLGWTFGLAVITTGLATFASARYPRWFTGLGLVGGAGLLVGGTSQALTGFSTTAMTVSLGASSALLVWAVAAAALMWRESRTRAAARR